MVPGSFMVQSGDHFRSWDHLQYNLGIICGTIWGSFAVQFGDHLRYNLGIIYVTRIICGPGSFAGLYRYRKPKSWISCTAPMKTRNDWTSVLPLLH